MHVIFISQCSGRAINKTRAILDSYANRVGQFSWETPITTEALGEIKIALKRKATRQSAIACYRNAGVRRMKLLWIVGSKKNFGRNGEVVISTRQAKLEQRIAMPWVKVAAVCSQLAGLTHDIGKASADFQNKIKPEFASKKIADPIRHELISAIVLKNMLNGLCWDDAWCKNSLTGQSPIISISDIDKNKPSVILNQEIKSFKDAVLYCVATHHKLFLKNTARAHINTYDLKGIKQTNIHVELKKAQNYIESDIAKLTTESVLKINAENEKLNQPAKYFAGITYIARAALILADHKVSSDKSNVYNGIADKVLFANTVNAKDGKKNIKVYNQTLVNHLSAVGANAKKMLKNMAYFDAKAPCLSNETVDKLKNRSSGRYEWQNVAANSLTSGTYSLVMNIAATGAGKTRMNARAVAVLNGDDSQLRITNVLNLRTLTLQTGDAYRNDLGIANDELSVVIGSKNTTKLHEYELSDIEQSEADSGDIDAEVIESCENIAPDWLKPIIENKKSANAVLMSPILISTIDYIIAAGDPRKQANHSIALLRLMHSDLIIDEIDSYEPKELSSVLRIIRLSAMFGKNVIVSSGTLPDVIAQYIYDSYQSGFEIYCLMNEKIDNFDCVIFDDSISPTIINTSIENIKLNSEIFKCKYSVHIKLLGNALSLKPVTKKGEIIKIENKTITSAYEVIKLNINNMHKKNSWSESGIEISIGLIRIANINQAIPLAKELIKEPDTYVCCYHSRHFLIQRFNIERRLDFLLNRKNGNTHIVKDKEIINCAELSKGRSIKIIVVATPVEEIGRDHDFDWAIIEPSSAQSIVQTAGRVNRHRLTEVNESNIGILQFNFKAIKGKESVFEKPGYEVVDNCISTHDSHDVCDLIDEDSIKERLNSNLRFNVELHKFSKFDTLSITRTLSSNFDTILNNTHKSLDSEYYKKTQLRDNNNEDVYYYDENDNFFKCEYQIEGKLLVRNDVKVNNKFNIGKLEHKQFFVLNIDQLRDLACAAGILHNDAFSLSIIKDSQSEAIKPKTYSINAFGLAEINN